MKNKIQYQYITFLIVSIIISIIFFVPFTSASEREGTGGQRLIALETKLLKLIQDSRLDHDNLLSFHLDTRLATSANKHACEMVQYRYFSDISLNGDSIYDRIIRTGYCPVNYNQTMAVILFNNFLSPDRAVRSLYDHLAANERAELKLYSPELNDIGISIRSGNIKIDHKIYNFYLAVCDLGKEGLSEPERKAFYLINALIHKKIDKNLCAIAEKSFKPFAEKIVESLKLYNGLSVDNNKSVVEQSRYSDQFAAQYNGCSVNKSTDFFIFSDNDPHFMDYSNFSSDNVKVLMKRMIDKETNVSQENRVLLNYNYTEIGLVFKTLFINNLNGHDYCLRALIVVSGKLKTNCY